MSHAGRWLNIARRVLAHVRAYLDSGQYGECRDNEQAMLASLSAWRTESSIRRMPRQRASYACESVGMADRE